MNFKTPFRSRHVERLPDPAEPTPFEIVGGWGAAHEAAGAEPLDDLASEREQRVAGAAALWDLHERTEGDRKRAMDERLRGVQRGHDYRGPDFLR